MRQRQTEIERGSDRKREIERGPDRERYGERVTITGKRRQRIKQKLCSSDH